jgi:hypothetical protein
MNRYKVSESKQLELLEGGVEMRKQSAKRVNIVSLKLVKESSLLYKNRCVRSPEDGYQLLKQFLGEEDREYLLCCCLFGHKESANSHQHLSHRKPKRKYSTPKRMLQACNFEQCGIYSSRA